MSHWPLTRQDITRPAYRSLAQGIAAAIDSGSLRPGARLPPHRELAWQLGLSVQTVSRAYEELIRADLISGEVGRGSFVRSGPRETLEVPWFRAATERPPVDLSMLTPVRLPQIAEAWRDSMTRVAQHLPDPAMYSFRPRQTMALYGGMAASWLARCGVVVPAQRILITNGATPAMFVALMSVVTPGDVIATESSTCHTLRPIANSLHAKLRGIEGDGRGMLPDALRAAAASSGGRMRAVFLLPSGAGPFARVIDLERREALAHAASDAGLVVVENDALGPVGLRRPPPVSSFAPECSFYFTGLSKSLSPGLRMGFLAMPEKLAERALNRHQSMAWMATPMIAEIARDWIESGLADDLLAAQRAQLAARNRLAQRVLGGRSAGFPQGLHRWLPLPEGCDEKDLLDRALAQGVAVAPGAGFAVTDRSPALRVTLGAPGLRELEEALSVIAALLPGEN
ncbi:DNA-binding transcriptional regulator, MocR family, contains an aminotransferase domain [Paracoccus isoporae]|uniref:DNA-binding transcriptional regulator, MocR family, contains an aminotransferase domain n=1 Tax=Paracoccus isoporae TaxID=591205 RepID=A0A1G7DAR4_9RHOB|nr:PLP-dependent aminotransferase family protein [Paracoccus isoporae]SDE48642.1 DNA-binding transcriptional regulator, MocR family, contains an aminotransferase domain [Paracoccus isoporae]